MLIQKISNKLAHIIALNTNYDKENEEIIAYGIFGFIQTVYSIVLIIVFGYFLNVLLESIVLTISISLLRRYSGGAHASSPNRCAIIGAIIINVLALVICKFINNYSITLYFIWLIISFSISYYTVHKFAPVDSKAKPIKNEDKRKKLRKKSVNTISVSLVISFAIFIYFCIYGNMHFISIPMCICSGILWQSFTLTHIGEKFLTKIDDLFSYLIK